MRALRRFQSTLQHLAIVLVVLTPACEDTTESTHPHPGPNPLHNWTPPDDGLEGEFLGIIYQNGAKSKDHRYTVFLRPSNAATANRLRYYVDGTWADTAGSAWMYEWTDPNAGGNCGDLVTFLAGDTIKPYSQGGRRSEVHRPGPGAAPTGVEKHCLRPGQYEFELLHEGTTVARFNVDYLPLAPADSSGTGAKVVFNATTGLIEGVEATDYDNPKNRWADLIVNVDRTPGSHSESRTLDIDNALGNPVKDTFANSPSPAGTEADWFRFSVGRSSSAWPYQNQGTGLMRLFWDVGNNWELRSGFYDPTIPPSPYIPTMRIRKFGTAVTQTRPDTVGLELKRPDETPDSSAITKRVVQVAVSGTYACSSGITHVWQLTDQYLNASCSSRGPSIAYRWQTEPGGPWSPYSSDTIYDFAGHAATGTRTATLEVRNTATSQSGFHTRNINVVSGTVTLDGPTDILDKQVKVYTSSINGQWFERYNPALPWFAATAYYQTSMTRIWPGGNYTVELRQQDSTTNLVKRGRLHITVCNEPGCGPELITSYPTSSSATTDERWSIFGGGPWISWGAVGARQAERFYDLLGAHDGATAFANETWVTAAAGDIPQRLNWNELALAVPGAKAFRLTINNALPSRVFGIALDPDLGANLVDDVSGYDATRGLVYVADADRAVGFMLLSSGQNALASVQQYGVGRWAPTTPAAAWAAQRQQGIHLLPGPRDVQFVLSAGETTGTVTYTLVMLRATNVRELRRLADEAAAAVGLAP